MSPVDQLFCRYDGPIPRYELAAALEAQRQFRPRTGARIGRVRVKPEAIIEAMARMMLELYQQNECATREDLRRHGFSEADVAAYGEAAAKRAQALLVAEPGAERRGAA